MSTLAERITQFESDVVNNSGNVAYFVTFSQAAGILRSKGPLVFGEIADHLEENDPLERADLDGGLRHRLDIGWRQLLAEFDFESKGESRPHESATSIDWITWLRLHAIDDSE